MAGKSSERSRKNAAFLKDHKVTRTTGQCPWGCGRQLQNGGDALINHLTFCKGRPKKRTVRKSPGRQPDVTWLHFTEVK